MTGRAYLLPVALAAAVGLPYVASDSHGPASPSQDGRLMPPAMTSGGLTNPTRGFAVPYPPSGTSFSGSPGSAGSPQTGQIVAATPWTPVSPGMQAAGPSGTHFYPTLTPFGHVANARAPQAVSPTIPATMLFRFDITRQWIIQNWPQVSSDITDPPLAGLRTAVVTGTGLQDIAGSMTYYFDGTQQLQRIMFRGTTGDPAPLVQMLTSHYQMTSEPALNGATYVARAKDRVTSVLRLRLMPMVLKSQPHRRYEVDIELNRPGGSTVLSEMQTEMLAAERKLLTPPEQKPNSPLAR